MVDPSAIWQGAIGILGGGVGLKFIEYWLSRGKNKADYATQIRDELRTENTSLRGQIDKVNADKDAAITAAQVERDRQIQLAQGERDRLVTAANTDRDKADDEVDEWKAKYYGLLDQLYDMKKAAAEGKPSPN